MTVAQLHDELAQLSGANPAGYISIDAFSRLTLDRLTSCASALKGIPIAAGNLELSASLEDVNWQSQPTCKIQTSASSNSASLDQELDISITSDFSVAAEIFVTGDKSKVVSRVELDIFDVLIHVRAENNSIILEGASFRTKRRITRTSNSNSILTAAGIDPMEAAYVEGHIGYGVVSQAISSTLGQRAEFELASIFPAVNFGSSIRIVPLLNGEALGVIPTEKVTIRSSSQCTCVEGPDFEISRTEISDRKIPDPSPNSEFGRVSIGGPIADGKDPLKDFGSRRPNASGRAGLYVPTAFAEQLTVEVMPAVKIVAREKGTIGYRAEASVGFDNFKLSFDTKGGGILLDIDLDISVSAYCDFEMFKGVRFPIGWAVILPESGKGAHIQLGFYPSVDSAGTVRLKSTLKKTDMGSYKAVVIGIGSALKMLGVTWWIGFLIDTVLAAILSNGLPVTLRKEISKYLAKNEWKLIEGYSLADPREWFPSAPFDARKDSLLVSVDSRG